MLCSIASVLRFWRNVDEKIDDCVVVFLLLFGADDDDAGTSDKQLSKDSQNGKKKKTPLFTLTLSSRGYRTTEQQQHTK